MFKLSFGALIAALAMFFTAFLYFAGPIAQIGYSDASEAQSAAVQASLAANLPETGTYMVPDPSTQSGTILYGKGPIATVHFNSKGFAVDSADGMIWGFALYLVVALIMAFALSRLDRRVVDFKSRATVVIGFSVAASVLNVLGNPIWLHHDWDYAIFTFIGDVLILCIGGLVLARWFMPVRTELAAPAAPVVETPPTL